MGETESHGTARGGTRAKSLWRSRAFWLAASAVAGVLASAGSWLLLSPQHSARAPYSTAVESPINRLLALRPLVAGRTSRTASRSVESAPPAVLGFGPSDATIEIARVTIEIERGVASGRDQDFHSLGLLRASEGRLDEALLLLTAAQLRDPSRTDVLVDLAAVHLSRFSEGGDPEDLFGALTAAEHALDLEPRSAAALFNRALAVSWLYLLSEGKTAWEAYLAADDSEPWASMAREHLQRLDRPTFEERWWEIRARLLARGQEPSESEIRQAVAEFPHRARMLVLAELLPQWAKASRSGRRHDAQMRFHLAREISRALESETGDVLLRESIAATERALSGGDSVLVARHAEAYELLGGGLELYYRQDYEEARPSLRRAQELFELVGDPLWGVPAFHLASGAQFSEPVRSSQRLLRLQQRFPPDRYPQLSGFCDWVVGTIESTTGDSEQALHYFLSAQSKVQRSAADYGEGPVHVLLADAHRLLGQEAAAQREYLLGLEWTSQAGVRLRYHMALYPVLEMLLERAEPEAARSLGEELVANAEASGTALLLAEAYLQRGRIRALLGLRRGAEEDFSRSRLHTEGMAEGDLRRRTAATRSLAEAELLIGRESDAAVAKLDAILESKLQSGYLYDLTRTLYLRGVAHADLGAVDNARRDLLAAIEEYERLRATSESQSHRRSTFELAQQTFDALIALEVETGGAAERSLALAERSRSRQIADLLGDGVDLADAPMPFPLPAGLVFVEYSVLPNQLLIWAVSGEGVVLEMQPVTRAELEKQISVVRNALSRGVSEEELQAASAALYDLLVAPISSVLPPEATLVVVPDRFLAGVPYAALYNRRTARYLVEERMVSLSPAIRLHPAVRKNSGSSPGSAIGQLPSALAVGEPESSRELFPELEPLRAAKAEAIDVARLYASSVLLLGSDATLEAFVEEAPRHEVIHFAGHARVGVDSPERSSLILTPSESRSGALEAAEIANLDLRQTRLVVLSACSALDADRGGRESVTGLAAAFFAAGVPAVVATLWEVEDRASREVMVRFHRGVAEGADPVTALRRAQLALLHGSDPSLRTPAAWAAFAALGGGPSPGS